MCVEHCNPSIYRGSMANAVSLLICGTLSVEQKSPRISRAFERCYGSRLDKHDCRRFKDFLEGL
jgi:hypothetical protein